MTTLIIGRSVLLVGLAIGLCVVASGAPPAAPDPWTKVPPLPTACYSGQDKFAEQITAATDSLSTEIDRQTQINDGLSQALANLDGAEKASRMQTFMMSNPQEAMKILQATQSAGNAYNETGGPREESRQKLEQDLTGLEASYGAALDSARAPFAVKFDDLDKRAKKALVVEGESWVYAPWAKSEYDALTSQANKAYERACRDWWPASGAFPAWLKRYREFVQAGIPLTENLEDAMKAQYTIMGIPSASFRSTVAMNAVLEYMKRASALFEQRRGQPELNYDGGPH